MIYRLSIRIDMLLNIFAEKMRDGKGGHS